MPRPIRSLRDLDRELRPTDWSGAFFMLACVWCFAGGVVIGHVSRESATAELVQDGFEREEHWQRIAVGLYERGRAAERFCAEVDAELHHELDDRVPNWRTLSAIVLALDEDGAG